jgi:hypothetical protein
MEPQRGKVPKDTAESVRVGRESTDVLKEEELCTGSGQNSKNVWPEVSCVILAEFEPRA